jgi:hypothetical protein
MQMELHPDGICIGETMIVLKSLLVDTIVMGIFTSIFKTLKVQSFQQHQEHMT